MEKKEKRGKEKKTSSAINHPTPATTRRPNIKKTMRRLQLHNGRNFLAWSLTWCPKIAISFHMLNAHTILFVLYVYPNFYICFIFNFISLKLNCFKVAQILFYFAKSSTINFPLHCKIFVSRRQKKLLSQILN